MSFFITLIELTDEHRRQLEAVPKIHDMIHKGLSLEEYRRFLHDLYHIVWHFCPVMAAAAARVREHHAELSRLDCAAGDGDHGATMLRVVECLEKTFASGVTISSFMVAAIGFVTGNRLNQLNEFELYDESLI